MFDEQRTRSKMRNLPLWLAGLFIATLALGTDEFVIAGLLPQVASDLRVSPGMAGQMVTLFALAFALGAPVLGVALDRYPRRRVLLGGLAAFVAANILAAVAPSFAMLAVARVGAGLAAAAVSTTSFAAAAQGAPEGHQGRYLSVVTTGLTVALFTGVPVGAWLGSVQDWRSTFWLIAAVGALAAAIIATFLPRLAGAPRSTMGQRLAPLRRVAVMRLVVAVFLCGAGGLMFYSYLAPLVDRVSGSTEALPALLLLVGIIGLASALLGGWLADHLGGRAARLLVIGGHALALFTIAVLVGLRMPFAMFVVALAVWSVFAWALNPPLQASTMEAAPDAAMTAVGLNISGLYLGTAAGGALGGWLIDHHHPAVLPAAGGLLLTAAYLSATHRATPLPAAQASRSARQPV
jgi:predicted MFS family arabinose efflux permease